MNAGPAFLQKLTYRRSLAERLEEFDMRLTHGQHRDTNTLFQYVLGKLDLQPERVTPKGERFVEFVRRNTNVIDVHNNSSQ